jgi:hypothetical protein
MIRQFTKFGYSTILTSASLTTSYSVIALTGLASNKKSTSVPDDCFLDSIELELADVASSDTVTIFLARDSAGKVPVTIEAADATQTVTKYNKWYIVFGCKSKCCYDGYKCTP